MPRPEQKLPPKEDANPNETLFGGMFGDDDE
jgi:hypothetical protein